MALITTTRRGRWTHKPPSGAADRAHPLGRRLRHAFLLQEGSGPPVDLVTGIRLDTVTGTPSRRVSWPGTGIGSNGDSGWWSTAGAAQVIGTPFTLGVWAQCDDNGSGTLQRTWLTLQTSGSAFAEIRYSSADTIQARMGDGGTTNQVGINASKGRPYRAMFRSRSLSGEHRLFLDTRQTATFSQTFSGDSYNAIGLSCQVNGGTPNHGTVYLAMLWDEALEDSLIWEWLEDPWRPIRAATPRVRVVYSIPPYHYIPTTRRARWTQKPPPGARIDRIHPQALTLTAAAVLNEDGGPPLVLGTREVLGTTTGTRVPGPFGRVLDLTNTQNAQIPAKLGTPFLTYAIRFYWPSYANTGESLILSSAENPFCRARLLPNDSGGQFVLWMDSSNTGTHQIGQFTRPSAAAWHTLVATFNTNLASSGLAAYVDGAPVSLSYGLNQSLVGEVFRSANNPNVTLTIAGAWACQIDWVYVWNGIARPADARQIQDNPHAFFRAATPRVRVIRPWQRGDVFSAGPIAIAHNDYLDLQPPYGHEATITTLYLPKHGVGYEIEEFDEVRSKLPPGITLDAVTDSRAVAGADPTVFNATVNPGANGCLVVCAFARDATIVGVTANGTTMTLAVELNGTNGLRASIFYLVAPPTGTVTISIDLGAGPTYAGGVAISLHGVAQSSPIDDTDSVETNGSSPSFSGLTTVTDGCVIIDALAANATGLATMNAETNRVQRSNFLCLTQLRAVGASTILTKSPAGAITMGWNIGANNSAYVGAAFKPAVLLPYAQQIDAVTGWLPRCAFPVTHSRRLRVKNVTGATQKMGFGGYLTT